MPTKMMFKISGKVKHFLRVVVKCFKEGEAEARGREDGEVEGLSISLILLHADHRLQYFTQAANGEQDQV